MTLRDHTSAWVRSRAQREGWSAEHVSEWTLGYWLRLQWERLRLAASESRFGR